MGIFEVLCCARQSPGIETDDAVEGGYTPILEVKHPAAQSSASIPVPYGRHVIRRPTRRAASPALLIDIDEKQPVAHETPSSSQSSIISVPSTRITIPSSLRTGITASVRHSCDSTVLGPPPSYHSRRAASPCPSDDTLAEHPVMARDWLKCLVHEANEPYTHGAVPPRTLDAQHEETRGRLHAGRETPQLSINVAAPESAPPSDENLIIGSERYIVAQTQLQPLPQLYHNLDDLLDFEEWNAGHDTMT